MARFDEDADFSSLLDEMGTDTGQPQAGGGSSFRERQNTAADPFSDQITALYASYGRTPTPEEIQAHRGNPGGVAAVENMLMKDWKPPAAAQGGYIQGRTDTVPTSYGGGGGRSGGMDSSFQPVATSGPSYDALNAMLMQMFSAQQARDSENAGFRNNIRTSLLGRINAVGQPKTMDSPEVAAQSRAYRTSSERNLRSQREALAERGHAFGLPSGAQDTGIAQAYTGARRDQGAFNANTLGQSLKDQRDELDRLLSMGVGAFTSEDMSAIQSHRDQLNAELSKTSAQQAGNLGQQDINLRSMLGKGGLDLQRLGLGNQDAQYWAKYGLDFGNSEFEHNYLLQLLGLK